MDTSDQRAFSSTSTPLGRQRALITGASSGIGYELARVFAREGYDLVLVARNRLRLEALSADLTSRHAVKCAVIEKDLAAALAPNEIFDAVRAASVDVDVLVNNAGFGTNGPFARADLHSQMQMLQVNVVALTHLTGLFLPDMIARKNGKILNVASTAAFQPGPLMAVYYASKAYVLSFSEAIADELRRTRITVTALCPGPTKTEFHERAKIQNSRMLTANTMDAATVARAGYEGMLKGRRLVIPGFTNRFLAASVRLAPRRLVTKVTRRMNQSRQ